MANTTIIENGTPHITTEVWSAVRPPLYKSTAAIIPSNIAHVTLERIGESSWIPTLISILALTIIVTFFVTSSDSGALVASMLSSKSHVGIHDDSPILSRVTWAILLGIIAAVLLYKGGLTALQTSVVICGVPFSIIVVFAIRHFYNSLESELDKN